MQSLKLKKKKERKKSGAFRQTPCANWVIMRMRVLQHAEEDGDCRCNAMLEALKTLTLLSPPLQLALRTRPIKHVATASSWSHSQIKTHYVVCWMVAPSGDCNVRFGRRAFGERRATR